MAFDRLSKVYSHFSPILYRLKAFKMFNLREDPQADKSLVISS